MSIIIHICWTVVIFCVFIAIVAWSYSKKRKVSFEVAANSIFIDEHHNQSPGEQRP